MSVTIGITTYNRKSLLTTMAASLYRSRFPIPYRIRVYDDHSAEYDEGFLRELFPDAATVVRSDVNRGADGNIWSMYRDFLRHDDALFFNADSDLLFNPGWLEFGLRVIGRTDGVVSLFNTPSHPTAERVDEDLCRKQTVGSAGVLFTRERVEELLAHVQDGSHRFDWQWCEYFGAKKVRVFCSNDSQVQHIGYLGQNSEAVAMDFGTGFSVANAEDGQAINDAMEQYVRAATARHAQVLERLRRRRFRPSDIALAPFRAVKRALSLG